MPASASTNHDAELVSFSRLDNTAYVRWNEAEGHGTLTAIPGGLLEPTACDRLQAHIDGLGISCDSEHAVDLQAHLREETRRYLSS